LNDRVRIYQGADTTAALIAEITGTNPPATINIPSDVLLVRFTTDGTENAGGFLGSFKSVLPVYCSGTTTYTDSSGISDDGSGDKKYNNNAICKWKIIPENLVPLKLTFESFSTEPQFDLLRIYDLGNQQLIATLSGDTVPVPIVIQSGKAYLVFMTNKEVTSNGWTIRWEPEGTTGVGEPGNPDVGIYPNPVDDQLWIQTGEFAGEPIEIRIFNAGGVLIKKENINAGNRHVMNTDNLAAGLYILTITGKKGNNSFRFAKF